MQNIQSQGFIRKREYALGHSHIMMITKQSAYAKRNDQFGSYGYSISKEGLLHKGLCCMPIDEDEIIRETIAVDYESDIVKQFIPQLKSNGNIEFELIADPFFISI